MFHMGKSVSVRIQWVSESQNKSADVHLLLGTGLEEGHPMQCGDFPQGLATQRVPLPAPLSPECGPCSAVCSGLTFSGEAADGRKDDEISSKAVSHCPLRNAQRQPSNTSASILWASLP